MQSLCLLSSLPGALFFDVGDEPIGLLYLPCILGTLPVEVAALRRLGGFVPSMKADLASVTLGNVCGSRLRLASVTLGNAALGNLCVDVK